MKIQGRKIGQDNRCFVIAEIGHNHCGDLELAAKLVRLAAKAGVDAAKLQKRDNKTLYTQAFYNTPYNSEQAYGACLDETTELLTERGWARFKDLSKSDRVATLSRSGVIEWHRPTHYISYEYDGPMYRVNSRLVDLLVTPDHDLYLSKAWGTSRFERVQATEAARAWEGRSSERWRAKKNALPQKGLVPTHWEVPHLHKRLNRPVKHLGSVPIKPLLRFLGYYISEGWLGAEGSNESKMKLCQKTNPDVTADMASVVRELGLRPGVSSTGVALKSRELAEVARTCGRGSYNKRIPRWVMDLDATLLWELFDAYMLGDGTGYVPECKRRSWAACTASAQLANDLQELALRLGMSASVHREASGMHRVTFNRRKNEPKLGLPITSESYFGWVWDITVPNHVFYVRRNGKTCWTGNSYGTHREALELSRDDYRRLQELADDLGIILFATAFDEPSVDFCVDLGMPAIKIASGDLTNIPLIEYVASTDMPLILSTGGGTLEDVDQAVKTVAGVIPDSQLYDYLAILQCTAIYPCPPEYLSLGVIQAYRRRYPGFTIGASIHDNGIAMSTLAYGLGARIIEKHITLDRTMKGTDHAFSLEPQGLRKLVRDIRRAETAMGDQKMVYEEELPAITKMGKSVYSARSLAEGHILTEEDLTWKSPAGGISPSKTKELIGRTLTRSVAEEQLIEYSDTKTPDPAVQTV